MINIRQILVRPNQICEFDIYQIYINISNSLSYIKLFCVSVKTNDFHLGAWMLPKLIIIL